jgi:hypothetical protein
MNPGAVGARPVSFVDVDPVRRCWPLIWIFASHLPQWLPLRHLACTAIVLLLGMPGRPLWQAVAVAAMVRPAEVHVCLAPRRSSLSLAAGARSGPALVETSKTVEGGTGT